MSFAGTAPTSDPSYDSHWSFGPFSAASIRATNGEGYWVVSKLHWLSCASGDRMRVDPTNADRRTFPCAYAETALYNSHVAATGALGLVLQHHVLKPAQLAWSLARAITDGLSSEDRGSLAAALYALTRFMLGQASRNPAAWELGASSFETLPADDGPAMLQTLRFMPSITLDMLCSNKNEPRGAAFFANVSVYRLTASGRRSYDSTCCLAEVYESARCNFPDLQERIDDDTPADHLEVARIIAQFVTQKSPPPELTWSFEAISDKLSLASSLRLGETAAFQQHFIGSWTQAYPPLAVLFSSDCEHRMAFSLACRIIGEKPTRQNVQALSAEVLMLINSIGTTTRAETRVAVMETLFAERPDALSRLHTYTGGFFIRNPALTDRHISDKGDGCGGNTFGSRGRVGQRARQWHPESTGKSRQGNGKSGSRSKTIQKPKRHHGLRMRDEVTGYGMPSLLPFSAESADDPDSDALPTGGIVLIQWLPTGAIRRIMLFFTTCVLLPCVHGWTVGAGILDISAPSSPFKVNGRPMPALAPTHEACGIRECRSAWWANDAFAIRCPHGFTGHNLSFVGQCTSDACSHVAAYTLQQARQSNRRLPSRDDPIRWVNEVRLPLGKSQAPTLPFLLTFRPPRFQALAMHEQSAAFRRAHTAHGITAASICDRPTVYPPTHNELHFIAEVEPFHEWYPHEVGFVTTHHHCAPTAYSNRHNFQSNILNGNFEKGMRTLVWCRNIAPAYAAENPPSILEKIVAPPSAKTSLAKHGVRTRKEWWWWQSADLPVCPENVTPIAPDDAKNLHHVWVSHDSDLQSLSRAITPLDFALRHVESWKHAIIAARPGTRSPGALAATHSSEWQTALANATMMTASHFNTRPLLDLTALQSDRVVLVPVFVKLATPLALVSDCGSFGRTLDGDTAEQAAVWVATILFCHQSVCHVHTVSNTAGGFDHVFAAVPRAPPSAATNDGHGVQWQPLDTIPPDQPYAGLAIRRMLQSAQTVMDSGAIIGALGPAVLMVNGAAADSWDAKDQSPEAKLRVEAFLARDAKTSTAIAEALRRADTGTGSLRAWASNTTSAADYASEMPVLTAGIPEICPELRWALFPEYFVPAPMPYTSQMLVKLPEQRVPPGWSVTHVTEYLESWAIEAIHTHFEQSSLRDTYCAIHQPDCELADETAWLADAPRGPPPLILGLGASKLIPHADGIGSYHAMLIMVRASKDGRLQTLDWSKTPDVRFTVEALRNELDAGDDLELLSHIFDGARCKATLPRQIRLSKNQDAYHLRVRQIAKDLGAMVTDGRYTARPLFRVGDSYDRRIWPLHYMSGFVQPMSGTDKPGRPKEKRRLTNGSWPYAETYEVNTPHEVVYGAADGAAEALSYNALSGPMRPKQGQQNNSVPHQLTPWGGTCGCCGRVQVRDSSEGAHVWWGALLCYICYNDRQQWVHAEPLKWHKEPKHTCGDVYKTAAIFQSYSECGFGPNSCDGQQGVIQDDYRWFFWEFVQHDSELPYSNMSGVIKIENEYWQCSISELVCNMGRSPISNICSRFSIRQVQRWESEMDLAEPSFAQHDPPELKQLIKQRLETLGAQQARQHKGLAFTDDILLMVMLGIDCARIQYAAVSWDNLCQRWGTKMTPFEKRAAGTAPKHIGARFVMNGGFGYLPPAIRVRTLAGARDALNSTATRDEYESTRGRLSYATYVLALDKTLLHGLHRAQERARFPWSIISLDNDNMSRIMELEQLIAIRGAAPFATAFGNDRVIETARPLTIRPPRQIVGSDACSHVADMAIFGISEGLFYVKPLIGAWADVHITVTESLGGILDLSVIMPLFPYSSFTNETDASACHAMMLGRAKSPTLQQMWRAAKQRPRVTSAIRRGASQAVKGTGNLIRDAGSRGYNQTLLVWAAALGIRLREIRLTPDDEALCEECLHIALFNGKAGIADEPLAHAIAPPPTPSTEARAPGADGTLVAAYSTGQHEPVQYPLLFFLALVALAFAARSSASTDHAPSSPADSDTQTPETWPRCPIGDRGRHLLVGDYCGCNAQGAIHWWCAHGCGFAMKDHVCGVHIKAHNRDSRLADTFGDTSPHPCGEEGCQHRTRWSMCRNEPPECAASQCPVCELWIRCSCPNPAQPLMHTKTCKLMRLVGGGPMSPDSPSLPPAELKQATRGPLFSFSSPSLPSPIIVGPSPANPPARSTVHPSPTLAGPQRPPHSQRRSSPRLMAQQLIVPAIQCKPAGLMLPLRNSPVISRPLLLRRATGSPIRLGCKQPPLHWSPPQSASAVLIYRPLEGTTWSATMRALGRQRVAVNLLRDNSEFRLCPDDPETLQSYTQDVSSTVAFGVPANTTKANDNGLKYFAITCQKMGTTMLRPPASVDVNEEREAFLLAATALDAAAVMPVRTRSKLTQSGVEKTRASPESVLGVLYAIRRALREYGSYVAPMASVKRVLAGLRDKFLKDFGEDALAPQRTQPWYDEHLASLLAVLLASSVPGWTVAMHLMMLHMLTFHLVFGARKDENPRFTRSSVKWYTASRDLIDPARIIECVTIGCFATVTPVSSKPDQANLVWGGSPQYFRLAGSNWNLAAQLLTLERDFPVPPDERHSTPLFFDPDTPDGVMRPFTLSRLASLLKTLMTFAIGKEAAATRTWHSGRITLAHKMRRANMSTSEIQCHLRWKSAESARIYGRIDGPRQADAVEMALTMDAKGVDSSTVPETEPYAYLSALEGVIGSKGDEISDATLPAELLTPTASEKIAAKAAAAALNGAAAHVRKATAKAGKQINVAASPATPIVSVSVGSERLDIDTSTPRANKAVNIRNSLWPGLERSKGKTPCSIIGTIVGKRKRGLLAAREDQSGQIYLFNEADI